MRLAIVGSRSIDSYELLEWFGVKALNSVGVELEDISQIVSGGARGVDLLSVDFALDYGIPHKSYLANWDRDGRAAGLKRNTMIVDNCDAALVLWDGESEGTRDTKSKLWKAKKPHITIIPDGNHLIIDVHFLSEWLKLYDENHLGKLPPFGDSESDNQDTRTRGRSTETTPRRNKARQTVRLEPGGRTAKRKTPKGIIRVVSEEGGSETRLQG